MTDAADDYPQIALRRSRWFYFFVAAAFCVVLSHMSLRLIELLVAGERALAQQTRISVWLIAFVLCGVSAAYLFSRMDFDKTILLISREGISAPGMITGVLPWTSIASVRIESIGSLGLFRQVALVLRANEDSRHLVGATKAQQMDELKLVFQTSHLQKVSADHLASTIRRYKTAFDKTATSNVSVSDGQLIPSSAWTGLTED